MSMILRRLMYVVVVMCGNNWVQGSVGTWVGL